MIVLSLTQEGLGSHLTRSCRGMDYGHAEILSTEVENEGTDKTMYY